MGINYYLISVAIIQKLHVHAIYQGESRDLCPHALGVVDGIHKALFFDAGKTDIHGRTESGYESPWLFIPISVILDIELKSGNWLSNEDYNLNLLFDSVFFSV